MAKEQVKLVVVLPVGPIGSGYTLEQLEDTIESILHYTTPSRKIIIQDNSRPLNVGAKLIDKFGDEIIVIRSPQNYGLFGGLYKAESIAFLSVLSFFDFKLLIRMDIDALWVGHGLEDEAIAYLADHPNVGMLGDFPHSEQGYDWPRQLIKRQLSPIGWLTRPGRHAMLKRLVDAAQSKGYKLGEHVIGGASILSPLFIQKLNEQGWLLRDEIYRLKLQEDHLFSLLCRAVGMEIGDFGSEGKPMSIGWRGLYESPETLLAQGKKLVHSTRFYKDMNEDRIRAFYRERREREQALKREPV
ncbi:MAG: glycosyltransferase [Anaerolineae bacterium]|nr:glycosyltransferase [Anaerolineae bacterium]